MKKLWGITVLAVIMVFTIYFSSINFDNSKQGHASISHVITKYDVNQAIGKDIGFQGPINPYMISSNPENSYGIYILRDDELVNFDKPFNAFEGEISAIKDCTFEVLKQHGGGWFTAKQYAQNIQGFAEAEIVNVEDWFYVYKGDQNRNRATFSLPVNIEAGRYGIKATAIDESGDEWYFSIIYAQDLSQINITNANGNVSHNLKTDGNDIIIQIAPNAGAIRLDNVLSSHAPSNIVAGIYDTSLGFFWGNEEEVEIKVTRNGDVVNWGNAIARVDNMLYITVPKNITSGQYVVSVTYRGYYNTNGVRVTGAFVIDNGAPSVSSGGGFNAKGFFGGMFIFLGLLGLGVGIVLVYGHKISYTINQWRYKQIDKRIYGQDAKSIRARKKAEDEAKVDIQTTKERQGEFFNKIQETRRIRYEAEASGMSIEEFKKHEKAGLEQDDFMKSSLKEVRENLVEENIEMVEKVENKPADYRTYNESGEESELLDSMKSESVQGVEEETPQGEPVVQKNTPRPSGILNRIKKATEED